MATGVVFEGKTLDDAVRKGLDALGLSRAEVSITVMEEGSSGFLGIGARPYKVRIMPRPGGPPQEPHYGEDRARRGSRGRDGDRRGGRERGGRGGEDRGRGRSGQRGGRPAYAGAEGGRGQGRGAEARGARPERSEARGRPERSEARARPERSESRGREDRGPRRDEESLREGSGGRGREDREPRGRDSEGREPRDRDRDRAAEPRPAPPAEGRPSLGGSEPRHDDGGEGRRRRRRGGRGRRGRGREHEGQEPMRSETPSGELHGDSLSATATATAPPHGVETAGVPSEQLAAEAQKLTEQVLSAMGFEAKVSASAQDDRADVSINVAEQDELLTGPKGEVRQALQHLLNLMINRGQSARYHLQLEINDFWKKREGELVELARSLADEAIANQTEAVTEYLNSQERRIVHVTLKEDSRVKTYALGTGLIKRVAVAPADFAGGPREDDE